MTADHPTREERYAAVIAAHGGEWTWRGGDDAKPIMCACGWQGCIVDHRAHVAAALVAADPAPAQPDAALSDDEREALGDWWDSDWPNDAALTALYAAVERIIAERAIQTIPEWQYAPFGVREPYNAEDSAARPAPAPCSCGGMGSGCRCEQEVPAPEVSRGVAEACGCFACIGNEPAYPGTWLTVGMTRMILCSECGNKRCPHGTDHRNACTASNEPGQVGSRYGSALPTDDGADCCRERTTAGGCGCGGES